MACQMASLLQRRASCLLHLSWTTMMLPKVVLDRQRPFPTNLISREAQKSPHTSDRKAQIRIVNSPESRMKVSNCVNILLRAKIARGNSRVWTVTLPTICKRISLLMQRRIYRLIDQTTLALLGNRAL